MSDVIELFIPIEPKAIQSVRFAMRGGFIRKYQPGKNIKYKQDLKIDTLTQLPDDFEPLTGPLKFQVIYIYAPLSSTTKTKLKFLKEGGVIMRDKKPDLQDNLSKGLCDALTGILWKDDSQITWCEGFKVISDKGPGIFVRVTPLDEQVHAAELPDWVDEFIMKGRE